MECFWRTNALTDNEQELLARLFRAHGKSVFRDNASTTALKIAMAGSGSLTKAITAALSTLGGLHGPIEQTYHFLERGMVKQYLCAGLKVPGWGNSFVKDDYDKDWFEYEAYLTNWPHWSNRIADITKELHDQGKKIYPNPSAYTAAAAHVVGLPSHLSPFLFIYARLPAWSYLCT